MDKNQVTGLLLIFLILIGWSYLQAPTQAEIDERARVQDSIKNSQVYAENSIEQSTAAVNTQTSSAPTQSPEQLNNQFGSFASSATGSNSTFTLENEKIEVKFASKGGIISEVLLKEHFKEKENAEGEREKTELKLLEDEKNRFEYLIPMGNGTISTQDLYFEGSQQGNTVTLRAKTESGGYIEQKYALTPDSYKLDYDVSFVGLNGITNNNRNIQLNWHNYLDRIEQNTNFEKIYSSVYFKETDENSDYCTCTGDDIESLDEAPIEWLSHVQQFFNTSLIAKDFQFTNGVFETKMLDDKNDDLKLIKSTIDLPPRSNYAMELFVGPNEFERLRTYENGLEEIIPFGRSIFGSINRWMIRPFFNWLSKFIGSKGIVIIVLIFIIKMIFYPLMYKMLHSQAKMGALKPQIAGLKTKFKDDPSKIQMETMKIYREYGVSPFGGCMPMLVQMPIWYALFRFFPASITFRQESFLWAHDLSSYDILTKLPFEIPFYGSHISLFTIIWAIATVAYTFYNTKHMDMSANPAMKYVQYLMPVTFLVFFNSYASGLTCYMFFSTLFNIIQTLVTKKFAFDDEKILAELEKKKSKPKKKGGFQARLEEAMKQQQEMQKSKKKK